MFRCGGFSIVLAFVAAASDVVFTSLPGPPEVESVALGEQGLLAGFAAAVGAGGCCAGQAADLAADPAATTLDDLEAIHAQKTGALFVAAVRGGAGALRSWDGDRELLGPAG